MPYHVETRRMTDSERERLVPALQQAVLAKKGLARFLFGGKKAAARSVEGESTVTVVRVEIVGARALMKAISRPGDYPAWLLALDAQHLLVVASRALPTAWDPASQSAFPHCCMTWTIGSQRALLDYKAEGPSLLLGKHSR